jgi:thymidylate kinase
MLTLPQDMIFDRFYIGETIYPYIYKRESKLNSGELDSLIKEFMADTVIVFIDADYNFINRAYNNKGEQSEIDQEFIFTEKAEFFNRYMHCSELGAKVLRFKNRIEGKGYNSDTTAGDVINYIVNIYMSNYNKERS